MADELHPDSDSQSARAIFDEIHRLTTGGRLDTAFLALLDQLVDRLNTFGRVERSCISTSLAMSGVHLAENEAAVLERIVALRPVTQSVPHRVVLLGYYFLRKSYFPEDSAKRAAIITELVEHVPTEPILGTPEGFLHRSTDPSAYAHLASLWRKAVQSSPTDAMILSNAAHSATLEDPEEHERLVNSLCRLQPDNPEWILETVRSYLSRLRSKKNQPRAEEVGLLFQELERLLTLPIDGWSRADVLDHLVRLSFQTGDFTRAEANAVRLLEQVKSAPDAMWAHTSNHLAHLTLGEIALARDEVEQSKLHLREAATMLNAATLRSFGPGMRLAEQLLRRGEAATVIAYLRKVAESWQTDDHRAERWISEIEHGVFPNFRPNLAYY